MKKDFILSIALMLLALGVISQTSSGYPKIIKDNTTGDTLLCLSIEQSRQIAIWTEERKELLELKEYHISVIREHEFIYTTMNDEIYKMDEMYLLNLDIINEKNKMLINIGKVNQELITNYKKVKKDRNKQKGLKNIFIGTTGGLLLLLLFL